MQQRSNGQRQLDSLGTAQFTFSATVTVKEIHSHLTSSTDKQTKLSLGFCSFLLIGLSAMIRMETH